MKRPSCPVACGISLDQGANSCPLHWQADSYPLDHQGSPLTDFLCGWCAVFTLYRIFLPTPACQHLKVLLTSRILPPAPTAARGAGRAVEALIHVCRETGVSEEARCSPLPLGRPWAGKVQITGTRYKRFYFSRKSKVQRGSREGSWAWRSRGGQALGPD